MDENEGAYILLEKEKKGAKVTQSQMIILSHTLEINWIT